MGILDLVFAADLLNEQFGIQADMETQAPAFQGLFQSQNQGLVFGDVVGALAEILLPHRQHRAADIHQHGAGPAAAGVAPAGTVRKKRAMRFRHFSPGS
ncbi:MAG TPA: hypothetical protein PLB96_08915 [Syntrophales bacterium]|nr:hypothetical protein [Syntrophales bacterium]